MKDQGPGLLAVGAVGAALFVLFIGAGVILSVGHAVPTEFWAAASSLSGALVGLLAPQPATKGAIQRKANQYHALAAAAPPDEQAELTAMAQKTDAQVQTSSTFGLRVVLLFAVGTVAFIVGIVLALNVGKHVPTMPTAFVP